MGPLHPLRVFTSSDTTYHEVKYPAQPTTDPVQNGYFTTKGAGRPSPLPTWEESNTQLDNLEVKPLMYFPYSATPTPYHLVSQSTAACEAELEAVKRSLGNLSSLPWDHRLEIVFQKIDALRDTLFYDQLAFLERTGGRFRVYDFDKHGACASYSLHHDYTAVDAEEIALRIEPSLFSIKNGGLGPCFTCERAPFTAPWRRLV